MEKTMEKVRMELGKIGISEKTLKSIEKIKATTDGVHINLAPFPECEECERGLSNCRGACMRCPKVQEFANETYKKVIQTRREIAKEVASEQMNLLCFNRAQVLGVLKEKALSAGWYEPIDEVTLEKFRNLYKQVFESPKNEYSAKEVRFLIEFDPRTTPMFAVRQVVPEPEDKPTMLEKLTNKAKQTRDALPTIF